MLHRAQFPEPRRGHSICTIGSLNHSASDRGHGYSAAYWSLFAALSPTSFVVELQQNTKRPMIWTLPLCSKMSNGRTRWLEPFLSVRALLRPLRSTMSWQLPATCLLDGTAFSLPYHCRSGFALAPALYTTYHARAHLFLPKFLPLCHVTKHPASYLQVRAVSVRGISVRLGNFLWSLSCK